jgi:hypothetical protein
MTEDFLISRKVITAAESGEWEVVNGEWEKGKR